MEHRVDNMAYRIIAVLRPLVIVFGLVFIGPSYAAVIVPVLPGSTGSAYIINMKQNGAVGDARGYINGVMTSGSPTLTDSTNSPFLSTDCAGPTNGCTGTVNKNISIDGAGASGAPLSTTIVGYANASTVTLGDNAGTTVPYSYIADVYSTYAPPTISTPQSGSGSYVPADTVTLAGGTFTTAGVYKVTTTTLASAAANATGSGGTNGACILTGTTGSNQQGTGRFSINATIGSNHITAIGAIITGGTYTTNPTSLTAEPVTSNCGLTGATLTIKMGAFSIIPTTIGIYSVAPSGTVSQGSTSGVGTGLQLTNVPILQTGSYTYGTDDSAAVSAAFTYAMSLNNGLQPNVYFPAGSYYMKSTTTPTLTKSVHITGDGPHSTYFMIDPSYTGDLISTSENWSRTNYNNGIASTSDNAGIAIDNFTVIGNIHSPNTQNVITLYDRNDFVSAYLVHAYFIHGMLLNIGTLKNQQQAYVRESYFSSMKAFVCGTATVPCIQIGTSNTLGSYGDSTNEITFVDISVFSAMSSGMIINNSNNTFSDTRLLKFYGLRIEQSLNGDNLDIGLPTDTGRTESLNFFGLEDISPPAGFWGIQIADNISGTHNYGLYFDGILFTGFSNDGGCINIVKGTVMQFRLVNNYCNGYVLQTAASPDVLYGITVDDLSLPPTTFSRNLGTSGVVKMPTWTNF